MSLIDQPTTPPADWAALSEDASLRALSDELDHEFHVEQTLLPSGVSERVMIHLPVESPPLLQCARMLTGAVVLAAVGCVALAAGLLVRHGVDPLVVLRLSGGLGAMTIGILLAFAAPRLVEWDAGLVRRLTGRFTPAGAMDVLLVRAGALLILVFGGLLLVP